MILPIWFQPYLLSDLLETMIEKLAESNHNTKEIAPDILNKFCKHRQINSSDVFIIEHSYST